VAQFVPLKVETNGEAWQKWASKYRHEGNGIPIIYIIRADGEKLYAKSGGKSGEELKTFMAQQLTQAGLTFTDQQAAQLVSIVDEIKTARAEADDYAAAKALLPLTKAKGVQLGQLGSHAKPAQELDELYKGLVETGTAKIEESKKLLMAGGDDAFPAALNLAEAVRSYSVLPDLKSATGSAEREVKRDAKASLLYAQAEQIDRAVTQAKSPRGKYAGLKALERLTERYPAGTPAGDEVRRRYQEITGDQVAAADTTTATTPATSDSSGDTFEETASAETRIWTDSTGRFRIEAALVEVTGGVAQLRKTDGGVISVPVAKLSEADQKFLKK